MREWSSNGTEYRVSRKHKQVSKGHVQICERTKKESRSSWIRGNGTGMSTVCCVSIPEFRGPCLPSPLTLPAEVYARANYHVHVQVNWRREVCHSLLTRASAWLGASDALERVWLAQQDDGSADRSFLIRPCPASALAATGCAV
jgi:hypothetical protein